MELHAPVRATQHFKPHEHAVFGPRQRADPRGVNIVNAQRVVAHHLEILRIPAKSPVPVWWTVLMKPCFGSGAGLTRAPLRSARPWCPRQIPRTGMSRAASMTWHAAAKSRGFSGVPGPGEITTWLNSPSRKIGRAHV